MFHSSVNLAAWFHCAILKTNICAKLSGVLAEGEHKRAARIEILSEQIDSNSFVMR